MLGLPILYFKGMRLMMFQLSGFYCTCSGLLSNQGENSINLYFIMVPLRKKY